MASYNLKFLSIKQNFIMKELLLLILFCYLLIPVMEQEIVVSGTITDIEKDLDSRRDTINLGIVYKQAWWQKTTIYQIYPRSFMDSNDDGNDEAALVLINFGETSVAFKNQTECKQFLFVG